jgi:hypothetical protein
MEEKRYDLSFMREYADLYEMTDAQLSKMFNCGTNAVKKLLSGEIKIKEPVMEEILYEIGYKNFDDFKQTILNKIELKKTNIKLVEQQKIEMDRIQKEKTKIDSSNINLFSYKEEDTIYNSFDFNSMSNKDRIIVSMLCDENLSISIKEISKILDVSEEYIKGIYKVILNNINKDIDEEKVKTK